MVFRSSPSSVFWLAFALWVSGCTTVPPTDESARLFCDGYFTYVMCTEDITDDGIADIMFFQDDMQVFMYHEDVFSLVRSGDYLLHRCALTMDETTRHITTDMLAIDDETPLLQELDLKKRLLLRYNQRRHEMDECNAQYVKPEEMEEDPFPQEDDFADFPEDELDKG